MIIDGLLPSTKMAAINDAEQTMISDLKLQATSYKAVIGKACIEERARWTSFNRENFITT
jgi:hypothetical protein